jgi:DUF2892 family protein
MKPYVGKVEPVIGIVVGVGLLALTVVGPRTWWGLIGVVPIATGLWGY